MLKKIISNFFTITILLIILSTNVLGATLQSQKSDLEDKKERGEFFLPSFYWI